MSYKDLAKLISDSKNKPKSRTKQSYINFLVNKVPKIESDPTQTGEVPVNQ